MRSLFLFCVFFVFAAVTGSQAQRISRVNYGIDIGTGFATDIYTPSINYYQNLSFGSFRHVAIGWTGRFSGNIIGGNPALKTIGNPGGQDDEISLKRIVVYNAAFGLTVNFNFEHIEFGANVDLLTISAGKTSKALYKIADLAHATDSSRNFHNQLVTAYPQMASLLPIALKKSAGNSEAYLRFWINQEFGIKLGYQLLNVVYNTENPLNNRQTRFVNQYGMPFAALSFHIQN